MPYEKTAPQASIRDSWREESTAKATNLTKKKHYKSGAKIDDWCHFFGVAYRPAHIHLKPTSMCDIVVVGGGGGGGVHITH